jgi:hypothetical protein
MIYNRSHSILDEQIERAMCISSRTLPRKISHFLSHPASATACLQYKMTTQLGEMTWRPLLQLQAKETT